MLNVIGTIIIVLFALELTIGIIITICLSKWGVYGSSF